VLWSGPVLQRRHRVVRCSAYLWARMSFMIVISTHLRSASMLTWMNGETSIASVILRDAPINAGKRERRLRGSRPRMRRRDGGRLDATPKLPTMMHGAATQRAKKTTLRPVFKCFECSPTQTFRLTSLDHKCLTGNIRLDAEPNPDCSRRASRWKTVEDSEAPSPERRRNKAARLERLTHESLLLAAEGIEDLPPKGTALLPRHASVHAAGFPVRFPSEGCLRKWPGRERKGQHHPWSEVTRRNRTWPVVPGGPNRRPALREGSPADHAGADIPWVTLFVLVK